MLALSLRRILVVVVLTAPLAVSAEMLGARRDVAAGSSVGAGRWLRRKPAHALCCTPQNGSDRDCPSSRRVFPGPARRGRRGAEPGSRLHLRDRHRWAGRTRHVPDRGLRLRADSHSNRLPPRSPRDRIRIISSRSKAPLSATSATRSRGHIPASSRSDDVPIVYSNLTPINDTTPAVNYTFNVVSLPRFRSTSTPAPSSPVSKRSRSTTAAAALSRRPTSPTRPT